MAINPKRHYTIIYSEMIVPGFYAPRMINIRSRDIKEYIDEWIKSGKGEISFVFEGIRSNIFVDVMEGKYVPKNRSEDPN